MKTASELGITPQEHDELTWMRDALDPAKPETALPRWLEFDMDEWATSRYGPDGGSWCGTACCIGGTMEARRYGLLAAGGQPFDSLTLGARRKSIRLPFSDALNGLFFHYHPGMGHTIGEQLRLRTAEEAIAAIGRFLDGEVHDPWLTGRPL